MTDAEPQGTLVHGFAVPGEGHEAGVVDWREAADGLCAEMLKQAPVQARKVADQLYEMLLTDVEAFLRDNVDYNLSSALARAERHAVSANDALRLVALALDVPVNGFPNYPTPEMLGEQCVERVEKVAATIEALTAALPIASVGTTEADSSKVGG